MDVGSYTYTPMLQDFGDMEAREFEEFESQVIRNAMKNSRLLSAGSTLEILKETDRLKAIKHEADKKQGIELLSIDEVLELLEKQKSHAEWSLKDLEKQKLSLERSLEANQAILSEAEAPKVDEYEFSQSKLDRMFEKWVEINDLLEVKLPMLQNALKVHEKEQAAYLERTESTNYDPPVVQSFLISQQLNLERLIDSTVVDDMFRGTHDDHHLITEETAAKFEQWVQNMAGEFLRSLKFIESEHFSESQAILEGVANIICDVEDEYLDSAARLQEALEMCEFNKEVIQYDSVLRKSVASYLLFLTQVSLFGYNPMKVMHNPDVHLTNLSSLEVLTEIASTKQEEEEQGDQRSLQHLKLMKDTVYTSTIIPFFEKYLQCELSPLNPAACKTLSRELGDLIKDYYSCDKTDAKLRDIKPLIEAVHKKFLFSLERLKLTGACGAKCVLVLRSLSCFESMLPKSAISDLIMKTVFECFYEKCTRPSSRVRLVYFKALLTVVACFNAHRSEDFKERLRHRFHLLSEEFKQATAQFFG